MSATPWPEMPGALVVARFAQVHGDGTDADDRPDWIAPVSTELMFAPSITGPLVYDPAGAKIIVEVAPFRAVVDADGFAVAKDGGHPIKLAPTDDPLMSRTGWLWTCSWAGGKVSFPAPSSGAINLADYIVAPPGDPVVEEWVARIPELVALIEAGTDPAVLAAAVEDYLTANPPASAPDATTTTKGILQLAGDLGGTATAPTVPGLAGKADADHDHAIGDVTGLQSALDGKQAAGSYAAASHNHDGTYAPALGPDDNYVTDAEKANLHTHPAVIAQGATMAAARAAIGAVPTSRTVAGKALTDNITLVAGDLSDFTEASQDVVGAMVAAAGGTYDDVAGAITLPAGGGASVAGEVQFTVARTSSTSESLAANAFTTYPLSDAPSVNIGGGTWNASTFIYTIPSDGLYLCLGSVRMQDEQAARSLAVGIGTANADAAHVHWAASGGTTAAEKRAGRQYIRLARFSAGDPVRLYIYSVQAPYPTNSAGGVGQYMSIIKLAD